MCEADLLDTVTYIADLEANEQVLHRIVNSLCGHDKVIVLFIKIDNDVM